jgi:hypothetical protein
VHTRFWWENLQTRDRLEDLDISGRIIFKWIFQKSIEVDAKTKESTRKTEKNCMEGIKKAVNERNLN